MRVLDIGCGFGGLLLQLKQQGYHNVHGIDINNEAILFCKENDLDVAKTDSIIQYCENYSDEKYDLIMMHHSLEHLEDQHKIFAKLSGLLDAGKKLFVPTALTWEAIISAKKEGKKVFDFEGIYDERVPNKKWLGFTHFKKSFGGDVVEYPGCFVKINFRNIIGL